MSHGIGLSPTTGIKDHRDGDVHQDYMELLCMPQPYPVLMTKYSLESLRDEYEFEISLWEDSLLPSLAVSVCFSDSVV